VLIVEFEIGSELEIVGVVIGEAEEKPGAVINIGGSAAIEIPARRIIERHTKPRFPLPFPVRGLRNRDPRSCDCSQNDNRLCESLHKITHCVLRRSTPSWGPDI
jgi:hypothetical protein